MGLRWVPILIFCWQRRTKAGLASAFGGKTWGPGLLTILLTVGVGWGVVFNRILGFSSCGINDRAIHAVFYVTESSVLLK